MDGVARAPAAGTILNALATHTGSAFAIDEYITAEVTLHDEPGIDAQVAEDPDADTRLIERCVETTLEQFDGPDGGSVRTESEVAMAAGLKSSSAAANATVLATLSALDVVDEITREDAARIGVEAAREVGVTVTGAFDDASASMLGGITITDNDRDELLMRDERQWDVVVWTPPERAYSAAADVERCRQVAPMADLVAELAMDGEYGRAMTVNGFVYCAALGFDTDPLVDALPHADGVSLSGTGPSVTAIGDAEALEDVREAWERRPGTVTMTRTQTAGARIER